MRKHFAPVAPTPVHLSVEEQAILSDEIAEVQSDIAADDQAVNRLMDTNEIIGELKETVATIPELGPIEEQLVAAATDMAVAGTDANPEELIEATPAEGVSTEGFWSTLGDKLKEIWKKIMEMITKAWQSILKFLGMTKNQTETTKKKVEKAIEVVEKAKAEPEEEPAPVEPTKVETPPAPPAPAKPAKPKRERKPFVFHGTPGNISIAGKIVPPEKLSGEIKRLGDAVIALNGSFKSHYSGLFDHVKKTADQLAGALKSGNAANINTSKSFAKIFENDGSQYRKMMAALAQDGGFGEEGEAEEYLASVFFNYTIKDTDTAGWNDVSMWVDIAANGYHNVRSDGIQEIPLDDAQGILDLCRSYCDKVMAFDDIDIGKMVESHKAAAETAMQHLSEVKPSETAIKDEQAPVGSMRMEYIAADVKHLGFALFNLTKLLQASARANLAMCKVIDTVCRYAETSVKPYA